MLAHSVGFSYSLSLWTAVSVCRDDSPSTPNEHPGSHTFLFKVYFPFPEECVIFKGPKRIFTK